MANKDALREYHAKRDFSVTPEPAGGGRANADKRAFVIQKHWARRLHYDFRLELDGTMKSWAVPKGPSYDPTEKRMAVHVEDHPLSYNSFEGRIPQGQYGAGNVIIWDKGVWEPVGDPKEGYKSGKLVFLLHGIKLQGRWALIRIKGKSSKQDAWLLIKEKDHYARASSDFSVVDEMPDSVQSYAASEPAQPPDLKPSPQARRPRSLPATLAPQLATLAKDPPQPADDWLYEIKLDGYRLLTRVSRGRASVFTRNCNNWSSRLPELILALNTLALPDGWYDGEIVVLNDKGIPDFQQLQNAFDSAKTADMHYFLFDLPFCDGQDLRSVPLMERRQQLHALLAERLDKQGGSDNRKSAGRAMPGIRFSDTFQARGSDLLASACALGLEGIIAKRKHSAYVSRRSTDWLKLKCVLRQEFVIGGYTLPGGRRSSFGALLLGVYDTPGVLRYAGKVGTGFNKTTLAEVFRALQRVKAPTSPFNAGETIRHRDVCWTRPELVAEVEFDQWTRGGHVRHAVFRGLRTDKPAREITRETAAATESAMNPTSSIMSLLDKQKITHPERVIDASNRTTKADLIRYYALLAPLILPHLQGRPVSFLRAPGGLKKPMFFQKHFDAAGFEGLRQLPEELYPGHDALMEIANNRGLLGAAQMNVVEFHTWNAVKTSINRPDRMVFDLDPGEGTAWPAVQEAALLLNVLLMELELVPFVKTSGGKGLHIVVPLQRRYDWDTVKDFSQQVVVHLARTFPDRFSAKSGPRNRIGKIFVDYLRNGFGATTVSAWSARARPGMAVSVPLAWSEVESLSGPDRWRVANIHERLDVGNTPWSAYRESAKTLTAARRILKQA